MALIAAHLEQLSISCQGIDSLPFPPPKIFTNALLTDHDITCLIRDTEVHERALFSVPPTPAPPPPHLGPSADPTPTNASHRRRQTIFNVTAGEVTTGPPTSRSTGQLRRNTAVAAVLGVEMHARITRRDASDALDIIDIEALLRGAEMLCGLYPLPGALDRVAALRQRWATQANTLAYYEAKVAEQSERLGRMSKRSECGVVVEEERIHPTLTDSLMTEEDLRKEEEELRMLEKKKKDLQERLRAMDKDLGGLLHM